MVAAGNAQQPTVNTHAHDVNGKREVAGVRTDRLGRVEDFGRLQFVQHLQRHCQTNNSESHNVVIASESLMIWQSQCCYSK